MLEELQIALLEYSKDWASIPYLSLSAHVNHAEQFLLTHSQLESLPSAAAQEVQRVKNWFWGHPGAILEKETRYLSTAPIWLLLSRSLSLRHRGLQRFETFQMRGLFKVQPVSIYPRDIPALAWIIT